MEFEEDESIKNAASDNTNVQQENVKIKHEFKTRTHSNKGKKVSISEVPVPDDGDTVEETIILDTEDNNGLGENIFKSKLIIFTLKRMYFIT